MYQHCCASRINFPSDLQKLMSHTATPLLAESRVHDAGAEDILPGWKGDTFQPNNAFPHVAGEEMVKDVRGTVTDPKTTKPWVEAISWTPRCDDHAAIRQKRF